MTLDVSHQQMRGAVTDAGDQSPGHAEPWQQQCHPTRPGDDRQTDSEHSRGMSHLAHETRTICYSISRGYQTSR